MSAQLQNVILPVEHDRAAYSCNEQQIMVLCYYYEKEFWKVFIGKSFWCNKVDSSYVEDTLLFGTKLIEMAFKYYGITWNKTADESQLRFENDEVYFVVMNTRQYPFTSSMEQEGTHCFLVYGNTKDDYLVNDNFYNVTEFKLSKEIYDKAEKEVYIINKISINSQVTSNDILREMQGNYYSHITKFIQIIKCMDKLEYCSAPLLDKFQMIYSYIKKDILILANTYGEDDYMKSCIEVLQEVAEKVKKFWCSFIKLQVKYDTVPKKIFIDKLGELEHYLLIEKRVKEEVVALIRNKDGLKDRLHNQLVEYLEINEVEDTRSVYEDHENIAVMYLLSYWEDHNQIKELDYLLYKNLKTYGEYKQLTYLSILRDGL